MDNPRFLTLTLTNANQNYQLSVLINGVDSMLGINSYQYVRRIAIQGNPDAGATSFKLGNSDLSATNFGVEFLASQSVLYEDESKMIILAQLYLRADAAGKKVHVVLHFR